MYHNSTTSLDDLPTDLGDHEWRTKVLPSRESHAPGGPSCDNHVSLSHIAPPRNTSNKTVRSPIWEIISYCGALRVSASSTCQIRIYVNITWHYIKWLTSEMGSSGNRITGKLDLNSLRKYILLKQKKESEKLGWYFQGASSLPWSTTTNRILLRHVWGMLAINFTTVLLSRSIDLCLFPSPLCYATVLYNIL